MRDILTTQRTYYFSPTGNNTNDGLAPESPWLSPAYGLRYIRDEIDLHGFGVVLQGADGIYAEPILVQSRWVGDGVVTLRGNPSNPSACQIGVSGNAIALTDGARLTVDGFRLSTSGAGSCLYASYGAAIKWQNIEFGPTAACHVDIAEGSIGVASGNYKISGGGVSHLHGHGNCRVITASRTVDILNPVTFSAYFVGLANASAAMQGMTFIGKTNVTGKPYYVHYNSTLLTMSQSPTTYLPGNVAGYLDAGTFGCLV